MTEAELRGHLLKTFYDLRHNADGWVPTSEMNLGGTDAAQRERIGLAGEHLAQAGLIEWKALRGGSEGFAIGMARITGHGVDVVEKASEPRIALRLPGDTDPSIAQAGTARAGVALAGKLPWENNSHDVAAQIAVGARRRPNPAALNAGVGAVVVPSPDGPLAASTVPINPTRYPENFSGIITVHNYITINLHSEEFRAFNAKVDELLDALRHSNELAGEVRDKIVAEIRAGLEILKSPKPDRQQVEVLLVRTLKYVADKAAGPVIGAIALAALAALGKLTGLF